MHKISIEDIELTGSLNYEFNDKISELEDCSVQANIEFKSMGDFIEAIGHVDGEEQEDGEEEIDFSFVSNDDDSLVFNKTSDVKFAVLYIPDTDKLKQEY